ncbi:MAG: DNA primase noncatalytic subunit PriX [Pyrobaculum sp.]
MARFSDYIARYTKTPAGGCRELFLAKGDVKSDVYKYRDCVYDAATVVETFVKDIKRWNIYAGVGYAKDGVLSVESMLYDRVVYDLDSADNPRAAVKTALDFAEAVKREHGATPLVFNTGFKGAHIVIPLRREISWEAYRNLWRILLRHVKNTNYVDYNMLQWNRVDRVPLTYNVKSDGVRYVEIIWPRRFTWEDFSWDALEPLEYTYKAVKIVVPQGTKAIYITDRGGDKRGGWVWRVVECGLPDGRQRFLFHVLIPRLVAQGAQEDEIFEVVRRFIENSCKKHNNCGKIYDSWIRSKIRSARNKGFKGFGLDTIQRKDPELYKLISSCLDNEEA